MKWKTTAVGRIGARKLKRKEALIDKEMSAQEENVLSKIEIKNDEVTPSTNQCLRRKSGGNSGFKALFPPSPHKIEDKEFGAEIERRIRKSQKKIWWKTTFVAK